MDWICLLAANRNPVYISNRNFLFPFPLCTYPIVKFAKLRYLTPEVRYLDTNKLPDASTGLASGSCPLLGLGPFATFIEVGFGMVG
jgi:hypothetical protein